MSNAKKFDRFLAWVFERPRTRVRDSRGRNQGSLRSCVEAEGIVKLSADDEAKIVQILELEGFDVLEQYEGVAANLPDPTVLETVAKSKPEGTTSAFKSKSTELHQDSYQFRSPFLGHPIAGIGRLPDCEVLSFPRVVEQRALIFADLAAASRALVRAHGSALLELLMKPIFFIDPVYCQEDPNLEEPPPISVVFCDRAGFRFHLGGGVQTRDPQASFALSLFRSYAQANVIVELLESGSAYAVNQRVIAHNGIRVPGIDGLTVLRRRLLRLDRRTV